METLNRLAHVFNTNLILSIGVVPVLMCVALAVFWGKRAEFSWHAIQNTSTTLLIGVLNYGVALLFYKEISGFIQSVYDALRIPTLPEDFWVGMPLLAVALIGIVAKDFVDYWNHRLMHTKWAWPTHAAHHSDTHVNAFSTFRVHALEAILMTSSYIFLLTWLQMPNAIPLVLMLTALHNMYVHMDLPYEHGPLKYLIASPVFHRWHHADAPEAYGKNLANHMPLWDRLFGTYYAPGRCEAPMGALASGVEDKNPIAIYAYPAFAWARLIRDEWTAHPELAGKFKEMGPANIEARMRESARNRGNNRGDGLRP
ncbi:sterol desaturase family protein [Jannaschia pohangensis]|uniref:Sterol desaturase/sphingolipid hydroxylase, fatty acid hydroxylase superfamily n=1 Tax=Jannaschia pohangensis TaxID=390807 RepID=A0A1I3I3E7_9RHOB|nr:sterol desaturase family protein [Jannaschia pohangensis]SFI42518.1 Sterol desaturase/sphingolipid hydroxylase, fatty acid hydroxylase superfamily [Jannaschia pohangensis]